MSLVLQLDCHWHCQHVEFHLQSCSVQILVSAVGAAWPHPNLSLLGLFFGEQKCKSPLAAQDNKKKTIQQLDTCELLFLHWAFFRNLSNEQYSNPALSPSISVSPWGLWWAGQQLHCLFSLQEHPSSACINTVPFSPASQAREAWPPWCCSVQPCVSSSSSPPEPGQRERSARNPACPSPAQPWCHERPHGTTIVVSGCCWEREKGCGMNTSNEIGWQSSEAAPSPGTLPCGLHGECLKPYRIVSLRRWKWCCESDLSSAHSLPVTGVESSASVNMGKVSNS